MSVLWIKLSRKLPMCLTRKSFPFAVVLYPVLVAKGWRLNSKPVFGSTTAQLWDTKTSSCQPNTFFSLLLLTYQWVKQRVEWDISCKPGELTLFLVVVMAQAALVSHKKLAVQFWYIRNRGLIDCMMWNTNRVTSQTRAEHSASMQTCCAPLYSTLTVHQTHLSSSGTNQVDACRVCELLAIWLAGGAVCELQQQPVPALDDGPSLGDAHVTDCYNLLWRTLRTEGRKQLLSQTRSLVKFVIQTY